MDKSIINLNVEDCKIRLAREFCDIFTPEERVQVDRINQKEGGLAVAQMDTLTKHVFYNLFEHGYDKVDEFNALYFKSRADLVRFVTNSTGNFNERTEKKHFERLASLAKQQIGFAKIYRKEENTKVLWEFETRQPFTIHNRTKVLKTPKILKSKTVDGYIERELTYDRGYELVFDEKMLRAYKLAREQSYITLEQPQNLLKLIEGKSIELYLKINDFMCAKYTTYLMLSNYEKKKDIKFLLDIEELMIYLGISKGYQESKTKVLLRVSKQLDKMIEVGHFLKSYNIKNHKIEIIKIK